MVTRAHFDNMARRRAEQVRRGWIAFDLDGTLAFYDEWRRWDDIGSPIMPMIYRVRRLLGEGHDVRIMTARIGLPLWIGTAAPKYSETPHRKCYLTGEVFSDAMMERAVQHWTETHVGARLPVQCYKDLHMIELWDDRAIQVEPNTGRTVFDEFEAEVSALRGKP
jgi:hypothetical protein